MKKVILPVFLMVSFMAISQPAAAQWGIGASYEMRSEDPENGFGVRIERSIFDNLQVLDLGMRAHFSYFNDENNVTLNDFTASREMDVYDYGLAAIAGLHLGLVKPYVGFGIGNQQVKQDFPEDPDFDDFIPDASSFYWNGFGGAEITILPFLSPFIEYRIANLTSSDDIAFDNVSRLAIGVNLRF